MENRGTLAAFFDSRSSILDPLLRLRRVARQAAEAFAQLFLGRGGPDEIFHRLEAAFAVEIGGGGRVEGNRAEHRVLHAHINEGVTGPVGPAADDGTGRYGRIRLVARIANAVVVAVDVVGEDGDQVLR